MVFKTEAVLCTQSSFIAGRCGTDNLTVMWQPPPSTSVWARVFPLFSGGNEVTMVMADVVSQM